MKIKFIQSVAIQGGQNIIYPAGTIAEIEDEFAKYLVNQFLAMEIKKKEIKNDTKGVSIPKS